MASIKERNGSYQIIISLGYDLRGKQIAKYKTWKPSQRMSKKEIKAELNRQIVKFEEDCKNLTHTTNMKFEEFKKEKIEKLKYVVFYTIALKTSLRRGEILGLEWKDINFEECLLSVERDSLYTKELGISTGEGKTIASIRILPVKDSLIDLLKVYKVYQNKYIADYGSGYHDLGRLFTKKNGEPMGVSSPNDYMIGFCKRTGLKKVSIHSFRHLNASTLIAKNFDPKVLQDFLGHKQWKTTMNIYAHTFQESQAKAMDAVANAIGFKNNGDKDQTKTSLEF